MWDGQRKVGRYLAADVLRDGAWLYQSTSPTQRPRRQPNRNPKQVREEMSSIAPCATRAEFLCRCTNIARQTHPIDPLRSPASGGFGNIQSKRFGESGTYPFKIAHARLSEFGRLRLRRLEFLPSARRRVTIGYLLCVPEGFHRKNGLHGHGRSMEIVPHQAQ